MGGLLAAIAFWGYYHLTKESEITETNNIQDYGVYTGNYDNEAPAAFIRSFFPDKLLTDGVEVVYHYRAKKCDTYGYEAWLEYSFQQAEDFDNYLSDLTEKYEFVPFHYDNSYMEFTVNDILELAHSKGENTYSIDWAEIGKILYNTDEKRIIYLAIGVIDGGGTYTDDVSTFFTEFNIDPKEFEARCNTLR
jgi:hypothetical protein